MSPSNITNTALPTDERSARIEQLEASLDEVTQQLLLARDAVLGAEAELSAVKARVAELEHHLHVGAVEIEELQGKVLLLTGAEQLYNESPNPVAKRLSPLLGRATRVLSQ